MTVSERWHELPRARVLVRARVVAAGCAALSPAIASAQTPSLDDVEGTLADLKGVAARRAQGGDMTEAEVAWLEALLPSEGPVSDSRLLVVKALLLHPELGLEDCALLFERLAARAERSETEEVLLAVAEERLVELKGYGGDRGDRDDELEPPPTCGACCHGNCDDEEGPPRISKRWGCAVDPSPGVPSALLILLALAWRRRTQG